MQKEILTLLTVLFCQFSFAQYGDFEIQENGLIYSESTMNKLKTIVDSLNLKFKMCDVNRVYKSRYQAVAHKIEIKRDKVEEAKSDIEQNMGFEAFQKKYPQAIITEGVLVVKYNYRNFRDKDIVVFDEVNLEGDYGLKVDLEVSKMNNHSNWVFEYYEKTNYSDEMIYAFYFPNAMESIEIPKRYCEMISYADCLIDTSTSKFKENLKSDWFQLPKNWKNQSKEDQEVLLDQLRSIRVVGSCSQDSRPRMHAVNIAMLSAETQNWEVFLKAHLDVMNDRFERVSDGNYAWGSRKTYIKELEVLDINVLDLIMGISFRIENSAQNHYYGNIRRIGRALAETQNRSVVESQLLSIIEDKELDLYNRVLGYFICMGYIHNLSDKTDKSRLSAELKKSIDSLPDMLQKHIFAK